MSLCKIPLILLSLMLFCAPTARAAERLVCAVVYKGDSFTATKTEILAIDPETGKKQTIFTDAQTPIVLLQHLYVFHFPATGGNRLFARAAGRGEALPFPGNGALYELSVDGSNHFRQITRVRGDEAPVDIFVNPAGSRIGYLNRLNQRQYLFIHDVATGELLRQTDISETFLDCFAASIGWLPGGKQLFFSLETGDEHVTSDASCGRVGSYLMDEDGGHLTKLPAPPATSRLLGVLPAGEYIFEAARPRVPSPQAQNESGLTLLKTAKDFSTATDIGFRQAKGLDAGIRLSYLLSPSGRYVAAARLPVPSSAPPSGIWLKDLQTGEERNILPLPNPGFAGPFIGLAGWLDQ